MAQDLVLYTCSGRSHFAPMVELAKILGRHGFAVNFAVVLAPGDTEAVIDRAAGENPSIRFHSIPATPSPQRPRPDDPLSPILDTIRSANEGLRELLRWLPAAPRAVVMNWLCLDALDVVHGAGLPGYVFSNHSVSATAVMIHVPELVANLDPASSFADMGDALIRVPGLMPFPAVEMPCASLPLSGGFHRRTRELFARLPDAAGLLVNSFDWLEPGEVRAMRDGLCVPPGKMAPPLYCVGPVVAGSSVRDAEEGQHECLAWLDGQPDKSVVFLCFGSMGSFGTPQLKEIAVGLEKSGQRFLWVVRASPPSSAMTAISPEFLASTEKRGMVVTSWVPQADVLQHPAVGAFVTHCGWNSVLEGIVAGVPLVCWPLYAEQFVNKTFIVEGMRIGVEMRRRAGDGFVVAEEVEAKVRWVMEAAEEGKELASRMAEAKKMAAVAVENGGSSDAGIAELAACIKKTC